MRDPYRVVEAAEGRRRPKVRRLEISSRSISQTNSDYSIDSHYVFVYATALP
jgi:hypothetical protein